MTAELTDNIIQLFIVMLCGIYSCYRALKLKSKNWIPVTLFYVSFGIGLLYWVLYIVLFGSTPRVFCVSELSWTASYVFLAIRLTYNMTEEEKKYKHRAAWLLPLFSLAMCIFFCFRRSYLENIMMGSVLSVCGYFSAKTLFSAKARKSSRKEYIAIAVLLFYFAEYALWISSYFLSDNTILDPYLLTDTFILNSAIIFIAAAQRLEDKSCHTI